MRRTPLRRKKAWRRAEREALADVPSPAATSRYLRSRSERVARIYEVRRQVVSDMLSSVERCQAGARILDHLAATRPKLRNGSLAAITCGGHAAPVDVHEILPRSAGGSIVERENCIAVCRACHDFIHQHPIDARAIGLLASRYADA